MAFALAARSAAATLTALDPSRAAVAAAIASASDGDVVRIPAGSATWTEPLSISKSIALIGAGVDRTIIFDNVSSTSPMLQINTSSGKFFRLSGITFRNAATRSTSSSQGLVALYGTSELIRLDDLLFDFPTGSRHLRFVYWWGAAHGVMDHITWNITGEQAFTIWHDAWAGGQTGNGAWAAPDLAGSASMVYCEDSLLIGTDNGGLTDGFAGARFCVRYSTIRNGHIATHGTESTGRLRGTRWVEVYENTFEHPLPGSNAYAVDYRSGSGVVFNNRGTGGHTTPVHMSNYRDIDFFNPWGMADGRNPFDRNDTVGGESRVHASGTHSGSSGSANIVDSSKSWLPNQWANYHAHRLGTTGKASAGSGSGLLVVEGQSWAANQWAGWTVLNRTSGRSRVIASNDATTITLAGGEGLWSFALGDDFVIYRARHIASNTATTLVLSRSAFGASGIEIATGDRYEILRVLEALDQPGMGQSDPFSGGTQPTPVVWPNQSRSPVYVWSNTFEGATGLVGARPPVVQGSHYVVGTPRPGYAPYTYPHPLRSVVAQGDSPGSPPPPSALRVAP